ncbi:DinB family protein [Robiginitalea sp. SC105]|uniref:DinB family protein n=1 Tax=Robiginitalea sp. SC105 TaxID=2762332 RepID=UPI001639E26B|nr:DinB family protein [Robiginitalea sp. SC105]MBC2838434.1 DinB family protein [Robiginitalea sp. SC105]
MKKLLVLLMGLVCLGGFAQEDVVVPGISGMLERVQGQIMDLAGAFSEEQMSWRPSEGVRSTGETILHTAASNYYIAMRMGFATPEDVDVMNMESITGKQNILDAFRKSSDFIQEKLKMVEPGSFGEEVDFGFAKMNRLSGLLVVLEHNGEHKGQLIAYARSNGVTPPWSQ